MVPQKTANPFKSNLLKIGLFSNFIITALGAGALANTNSLFSITYKGLLVVSCGNYIYNSRYIHDKTINFRPKH
jgi:hypothetical protein